MAPLDFNAPTPAEKAAIRRRKAAITRRLKGEVFAKYGIEKLPKQGDRALVTGGQGTGKSRTTAQRIATLRGEAAIWWLVPTLEKAAEQAEEYAKARATNSMTARVVRGRGAPDPRADGVEPMCPRHGVVTRAASMGVNVQEAICNGGCPLRFSCGFQRQQTDLRDNPSGLFLMASDYLWLPCPAPRPDIVIADESLIEKATEIISLDPARIVDDQKWACPNDLDSAMAMRQTAILVRAAVVEHPGRELAFLRSYEVTDAALKKCVQHLVSKEEAKPEVNGSMTDKQISAALDMVEAREILKVLKLFRQIGREFAQPRNRLNSVWFDPEHRVMVAGEVERHPRVFVSHVKTPRLRKETPVLALDGTGSIDLNRKVFRNHMTLERFAAPRDAKVYQVTGKTFSRQSITGTNRDGTPRTNRNMSEAAALRAQVVEFLDMIPGDVLLVSYKAAIEALIDDLPPHVTTAHFGGLRGLNSFEHCETVVVMGREQPSAPAIEALARPFTATDAEPFMPVGEYVEQSRGRRTRDDTEPNIVVAQVHFDPRCQIVLEQVREAEMVQAIDRVRPIFNHRKVFVLNSLPLDLKGIESAGERASGGLKGLGRQAELLRTGIRTLSVARSLASPQSAGSRRWSTARSAPQMRSARQRTRSGSGSRHCRSYGSPPRRPASSSRRSTWRCSASPARAAEAAHGTGEAKDALAQMGIALRDQSGNLRRSEDLLGDVADAFARIEDPAERVRLAFKLFDSEGVALVNLLRGGSDALEEMRERARDLGIVLDEHLVRDAERARTELDSAGRATTKARTTFQSVAMTGLRRAAYARPFPAILPGEPPVV